MVCLAISGKKKFEQHFVFIGDFSLFYEDGIRNQFHKELFTQHGFTVTDFCEFSLVGRILKGLTGSISVSLQQFLHKRALLFPWIINAFLRRHINSNKRMIVNKVIKKLRPDVLLTDQSITDRDYIPEIFRSIAIQMQIPVYVFAHGAAGGLHSAFSEFKFDFYVGCTVLACSENEPNSQDKNRIILGDMSSSYPYVHYVNKQNYFDINFMKEKKYKVGFIVGGTMFTSTNGWYTMQEIIIDLSADPNVAMVLKLHPREAPFIDRRMLRKFDNLIIVDRETDRSRVSKWADIVVCSDHCSTVFEPMILGKKVVAVEGRHIPKYKNIHSPLKHSSVMHITSTNEFDLDKIPNADPEDPVVNTVAWGGHGKVDLAELFFNKIEQIEADAMYQ